MLARRKTIAAQMKIGHRPCAWNFGPSMGTVSFDTTAPAHKATDMEVEEDLLSLTRTKGSEYPIPIVNMQQVCGP